ncbi:MAG: hypothetical protein J6V72_05330 [Kiritimatiellae bacterium]|nr:hypothetical protein [Kiritimatiellia bacterium]
MNKAKIEALARKSRAKSAKPEQTAPGAPETACKREERRAVNLTPETINALADAFSRELRHVLLEVGPILARLTAADTLHTCERTATVLGRALVEAQTAAAVMAEAGVTK